MTTRGFAEGEAHTRRLPHRADAIFNRDDEARLADIRDEVQALLDAHPLYPEL